MKLNEKKFFELAKENKFEAADLVFSHSYSLSCSIFHKEVESLTESDTYSVVGRAIVNGKFGLDNSSDDSIVSNEPFLTIV